MKNHFHQFIAEQGIHYPGMKLMRHISRSHDHTLKDEPDRGKFLNKVAIITGASSGIGLAIAKELARHGAKVVLASRNRERLQKIAGEISREGGLAIPFATDVTKKKECESLVEGTLGTFGKLDILVNNAGISMRANFLDTDLEVIRKVMDTNFWGTVYCTKYALPHILKEKGSIVGVSSICGITPLPGRTGYAASKHAMDGFLESLRLENANRNLNVLLVHPGFTSSNIRITALNNIGEPQTETPLDEEKLMPAEKVAKEVIEGILQRKKNITLTSEGRLITWIYKKNPGLADWLIYREMKSEAEAPF